MEYRGKRFKLFDNTVHLVSDDVNQARVGVEGEEVIAGGAQDYGTGIIVTQDMLTEKLPCQVKKVNINTINFDTP